MLLPDTEVRQQRRLEQVLRQAIDADRVPVPYVLIAGRATTIHHKRISSLESPQHIADRRLRGVPVFDGSGQDPVSLGRVVDEFTHQSATRIYRVCPASLLFGFQAQEGSGTRFPALISSHLILNQLDGILAGPAAPPALGTVPCALQSAVLNLTGIRQLGFPLCGRRRAECDRAGQTVLAALALVLFELWSEDIQAPSQRRSTAEYEVLGGGTFAFRGVDDAIALLEEAQREAESVGLVWGGGF
jgi:hypothetical protein